MIGIDEVGRGPLAGPLLVCAVRLKNNHGIVGLNDSKKLTAKNRIKLAEQIKNRAEIGYGWVSAKEIDKLGLTKSMQKACKVAVGEIFQDSKEQIIIDGNINYLSGFNAKAVIKADQTIGEVSAASIVAKVTRDELMEKIGTKYPKYNFAKNKGYGTAEHINAIKQFGYCPEHRKSYIIKK
jgi:ribonuclease HII